MTRARDVADTQDNLGGAVPPFVAGKNAIINGGFDVWQRGTSGTVTSNSGYISADRWLAWTLSSGGSVTLSRQATGDTTNLPFIQYCGRFQRVAGNTNTGIIVLGQVFETVNSIPFAGKSITYSFWARAGSNFSPTSNTIGVEVWQATTTDSSLPSMLGTKTNAISGGPNLTTSWQRFSFTGTVASTTTQIAPVIFYSPTGTAGANDYLEVTGVQLEVGSVATPFSRAGGTIQGELAVCQRYFEKSYNLGEFAGSTDQAGSFGFCAGENNATAPYFTFNPIFQVRKRTTPTVTIYDLVGNSGKVSKVNGSDLSYTDNQTAIADRLGQYQFRIYATFANAAGFYGHYTASAEL